MAQKHNSMNDEENEKPRIAIAVIKTLTATTIPVPKRLIICALKMLEITVPPSGNHKNISGIMQRDIQLKIHQRPRRTQQRVRQTQTDKRKINNYQ
jgi:hypothetical protein